MAGYSGTPLAKKLGVKAGAEVLVVNAPSSYLKLLAPLPVGVSFVSRLTQSTDLIHVFTDRKAALASALTAYRARMSPSAVLWVSWPKKASGVPTDVTEDVVRELALPLGLVDVKVCAVDHTWSGLKLVIRLELRGG